MKALAARKCHEWLRFCLDIGWARTSLPALCALWWKHHDEKTGELTAIDGGAEHE
jgi:hypothetical protein